MLKVKISGRKVLELDRSEYSTTYGNAGQPDAGEFPLQARMEETENVSELTEHDILLDDGTLVCEACFLDLLEQIEEKKKKKKKDKCYKKAKRKFKVFPSAYAGSYIARCRSGKIKESIEEEELLEEAKYQGRTVTLNKPMKGDVKKFKVYVKDPKTGNVKKVNFGDKTMRIKKSNPQRRKSFRARHNCDNPGPKTKAKYWSCKKW